MRNHSPVSLFDSYCYGPVDLLRMHKGDSTMWLSLREPNGKKARAVYRGCVYWRTDELQTGTHLSLVQKLDASALLQKSHAAALQALQKNSRHVEQLVRDWENEGLSFYLHLGSEIGNEFLVVAKSLEYTD